MPSRWSAILFSLMVASAAPAQRPAQDLIAARDGDVIVVPIAHASVYIAHGKDVVLIDPARFGPGLLPAPPPPAPALIERLKLLPPMTPDGEPNPETLVSASPIRSEEMVRFKGLREPTLILVTHIHDDHLDPPLIAALKTAATRLIVPPAAASRLLGLKGAETMANGDTRHAGGVIVEAVPMYNPQPDATSGLLFHPKGRGNGYVVTVGGKRIYVAGDTGCTPEMKRLQNIEIAFLPMNTPETMAPAEAAECARAFRPAIVYPYHYFKSEPRGFESALKGTGIEVRLRDWYLGSQAASPRKRPIGRERVERSASGRPRLAEAQ